MKKNYEMSNTPKGSTPQGACGKDAGVNTLGKAYGLTYTLYRTDSGTFVNDHIADHVIEKHENIESAKTAKKLGTFPVYMTSVETMWGVILFVKFAEILGNAGLFQTLAGIALSMACQLLSASSLSAIASNGHFQSSGAYYMVVRSLGPAIGAAIGILYFLGMSLLATVEILGACEAVQVAFKESSGRDEMVSKYWDQVIFGFIFLVGLCLVRGKDSHLVHHLGLIVMVVLVITFASSVTGIFDTLAGWGKDLYHPSPKLSSEYFKQNLHSNYDKGNSFGNYVLTLLYPTFIGIFQGANKVSELKDPYRSVPRGAFLSVLTSGVLYTVLFVLLAAVATSETLKGEKPVLITIGWPTEWIAIVGTVILGLGSALSCIDVAPLILQSIASDGYIPFLAPFAKLNGKSKEPRRALIMTFILCIPPMFVEHIETVATYTSLAFLCMYASMNASCALLSLLNLHSWRPRFQYYHWTTALLGLAMCLVIMFLIEPIAAGVILFLLLLLVCYVQIHGEKVTWGHGLEGLKYKLALSSLLGLEDDLVANGSEVVESKNDDGVSDWRPQLLCYVKLDDQGQPISPYLLDFVRQIKGSKGLNIIATIIDDKEDELSKQTHHYRDIARAVRQAKIDLQVQMIRRNILGFADVITAPLATGESTLIQTLGLGKLRPNTLVTCWPKRKAVLEEDHFRGRQFLRLLGCATAFEKAVVALKPGTESFPLSEDEDRLVGTIDVWWVVHDGGLLLLLAHLLKMDRTWSGCRIRIFTAVDITERPVLVQRALAQYLHDVRIEAEVHVVDISKADVAEFSNDWTLRKERRNDCFDRNRKGAGGITELSKSDSVRDFLLKRETREPTLDVERNESMPEKTKKERSNIKDVFEALNSPESLRQSRASRASALLENNPRVRAACHLRAAIEQHSSDAQLVVLNLPVPSKCAWEDPITYLDLVDNMTDGLQRTLLVHGSGVEAISRNA